MITLSRRRLAFIAVAAAVALALGYAAAKVFGPGRAHPAAPAAAAPPDAASVPPAASTPPAASSTARPPAAAAAASAGAASPSTPARGTAGAATSAGHRVLPTSLPTTSFVDARAGLRVSYPQTWTRAATGDTTRPLLVLSHDGASLLIRAVKLSQPINGARLAVLRDATGQFIRTRHAVKVIAGPRLVASSNLPGFLYIYSFYDPLSRARVAHSQITLFAGRRMYTLVFQTARDTDLTRFALLFDKITASFRAT